MAGLVMFTFIKWTLILLITDQVISDSEFKRQIHIENICPSDVPQCVRKTNDTYTNVLHATAVGHSDTLHYVFSTFGYPGVLVARTTNTTQLNITRKFFSTNVSETAESLTFSEEPYYVYGMHFLQLIEYSDTDDKANMSTVATNSSLWVHHSFADGVHWSNSTLESDFDQNQIVFKIQKQYSPTDDEPIEDGFGFLGNGSLIIQFTIGENTSRMADLPRLMYNSNGTLVDLILDNMTTSFADSRYAVEIAVVSSDETGADAMAINVKRNIDDEHTPGVFEMIDLATSQNQSSASYLQWKPVCYTSTQHSVKSSTKAKYYPLPPPKEIKEKLESHTSLVYAYFGKEIYTIDFHGINGVNVSFGLSEDKYFRHSNYTSWSFVFGYGEAPKDEISVLVLCVISVGLGVPVLLIVFGGLGTCVRKAKKKETATNVSNEYTAIN